ncbi:MAG: gliding motility-associated C-terminal domain-containing protein [Cyclobacteriaceae bacterium]|jgi:gliding motility-associated-like protein|nr:gliding motility-associated C-terminal domain-containing protein [Cyclobacteriaceae bacterium]
MGIKSICLFIVCLLPVYVQAQYLSQGQRFSVDEKKGCASLTLAITNTNLKPAEAICGPGNPCDITWGDGSPAEQINSSSANHTYTQPGTYTLRILYQTVGFDEIQIVVTPNTPPPFNVFTCGNNEVQIQVTDTNYDGYIINFGDGSPEVLVPQGSQFITNHTYITSGSKTIEVRGKDVDAADNCVPPASKNVLALPSLPAPFINELDVVSDTQIDFLFTTLPNIVYRLEIATNNNSTFQVAQTLYNQTVTSLTNLRTDDNFYCFRLGAFDPCNNTIAYSNIICSTNFDVTAQNNQNELSWTTNTATVTGFTVIRDGVTITNTNGTSFIDTQVTCKTEYCYQLVTNYTNGSSSISLPKCVTAVSTDIPTPVVNATSVVGSNGVDIIWEQDPAFQPTEYRIFRREGPGNFQFLTTTTTNQLIDSEYATERELVYQIDYTDVCDNTAPMSDVIAPIRLSGSLTRENYSELTWLAYSGWQNGVDEYVIEKYSEDGQLIQTLSTGSASTTFTDTDIIPDQQVIRYVIKANPNTIGLGQSVSNEITIIKSPNIFYPTAFTPDRKGPVQNEVFKVFGQYIAGFEMQIFNRWGELLFTSDSIDTGWDGTFNGKEAPEGTYAFIARLTDLTGNTHTRSGSVVLLRKK